MVLISNDRTSASKKINGMALIRTLTVSTTAFERTKGKFDGFWQTVNTNMQNFSAALRSYHPGDFITNVTQINSQSD